MKASRAIKICAPDSIMDQRESPSAETSTGLHALDYTIENMRTV